MNINKIYSSESKKTNNHGVPTLDFKTIERESYVKPHFIAPKVTPRAPVQKHRKRLALSPILNLVPFKIEDFGDSDCDSDFNEQQDLSHRKSPLGKSDSNKNSAKK